MLPDRTGIGPELIYVNSGAQCRNTGWPFDRNRVYDVSLTFFRHTIGSNNVRTTPERAIILRQILQSRRNINAEATVNKLLKAMSMLGIEASYLTASSYRANCLRD